MTAAHRRRRLRRLAGPTGRFAIVAVDHRDSLRRWLDPDDPDGVPDERLARAKVDVCLALSDLASGFMLDPEIGLPAVRETGALPRRAPIVLALEAQGYFTDPGEGTTLLEGWDVARARAEGATAVKLLVLVDPKRGEPTAKQVATVSSVVSACRAENVPLVVEPLAPGVTAADRRRVTVTSAEALTALGADLAKLPFPVDPAVVTDREEWFEACRELDAASRVPWVLLSGGGDIATFAEELSVAGRAGCSGFAVGRALWGDAIGLPRPARRRRLREVVHTRLAWLVRVAERRCRPLA